MVTLIRFLVWLKGFIPPSFQVTLRITAGVTVPKWARK